MPRQNRTLRTLRGGGTVSWGFAPSSNIMNNPLAYEVNSSGGAARSMPSVSSHGLPMQRGGGGGASYGFVGQGLAGGMAANSSTHCQPLPVASLNTRVQGGGFVSPKLRGGKRNATKRNNNKRRNRNTNKSKRRNNKHNKRS